MTRLALALPTLLAYALFSATPVAVAQPASAATEPAAAPETTKLSGQILDGLYLAPSGAYAVPMPILQGEAAVVMDTDTVVVFRDKQSVLLTIAAFPMPALAQWEHHSQGPRDYLIAFFRDNILRDYTNAFPASRVESVKFVPDYNGGTLLTYTLMPGGSAFDPDPVAVAQEGYVPAVAKRGHLVFVRDRRVFVLAIELAERVTKQSQYNWSTAEEDRVLLDRLATVITALRIPAASVPAETAPNTTPAVAPAQ